MTLIEKIEQDLITALKAKEEVSVAVLRLLKSALKNKAIELKKTLTDEEAILVIRSEIKKRQESVEAFTQGGRQELADKEILELTILQKFLPPEISLEEIKAKVISARESLPEEERLNFGKVMSAAMTELKGLADGQKVSQIVKEVLSQK
jgi:hypothetical protein